ncbi:MAG: ribosome maturation factor RimM [Chloroflexota bacterium]
MSTPPTERLVVGLVRGLHGLRGGMRVEVLTDDPARFAVGSVLHPEGRPDPLTVTWVQEDGPGLLVRFREVPDRTAAEAFRDRYLEAESPVGALPAGEYYWHEIIGARVTTTDGRDLGTVQDVFRAGGGEVFVVEGGAWGEVMVPAVSSVVRELAPADGRIVVDAEGLALDEEPPQRRPRGRRTSKLVCSGGKPGTPGEGSAADAAGADPASEPAAPEAGAAGDA